MRDGGSFSVPEKLDNRAVLHYNTSKMNDSKMKGELGVNPNMEFAIKTAQAYNAVCKPLCQELKLPQTAFDMDTGDMRTLVPAMAMTDAADAAMPSIFTVTSWG